jgi:hypothetical protein
MEDISTYLLILSQAGITEAFDLSRGKIVMDKTEPPPNILQEPEILRYGNGLLGCSTNYGELLFKV